MVWFRVDDGFHSHPKTADVSFEARGLWVTAGSWCSQHLTDGAVPAKMLKLWGAKTKLAIELVRSGLWEQTETGFQFHDWSALNPRREDVLGKRAADANRKRESRRSPHSVRADTPRSPNGLTPDSDANNVGVTSDVRAESSRARPRPVPSHPIPTEKRESAPPFSDPEPDPDEVAEAQRELDEIDPPPSEPPVLLPQLVWDAWLQTAHGGREMGHYPRGDVFACCEVLTARGLGVDAFRAAADVWAARKIAEGKQPRFSWFAQDLALELDHPRKDKPAPADPVPLARRLLT